MESWVKTPLARRLATGCVPDECDIASGTSGDCQPNGIPDDCEADCNGNRVADDCDIATGTSADCQPNGIPDDCEPDCSGNGVPDDCDIATGTSADCQPNGIPDDCERDCNQTDVPDDCDIATGISSDCNGNGIPDECEGCGALLVQVNERRVGSGGPTVTPIEGMQIAVFDRSEGSCAREIGLSPRNYPDIFVTCEVVGCRTTDADGTGRIALDAGDYLVIGEFDPDGFPPNDDGDEELVGIRATHFQCAADNDPNTVTMCKSIQVIILSTGEVISVSPGGGPCGASGPAANAAIMETPMVELTNVGGPDGSISTIATGEEFRGEVSGYMATGAAVVIDSTLHEGELLMTVVIPFAADDLNGGEPLGVDLIYYNPNTGNGGLAVAGNAQPSPGHEPDVIGDRFVVVDTTIQTLSGDLGDYGVFWNPGTGTGFVWANVDYTAEFATARQAQAQAGAIPTVSEWGLVVMTLLLLTGIMIKFGRRSGVASRR